MQAAANPDIPRVNLRLPLTDTDFPEEATPLEVAFAAASLSNAGSRPAARLALSYQHPDQGWLGFPPLGTAVKLLSPSQIDAQFTNLNSTDPAIWQLSARPVDEELTWFLAGTLSQENGTPLTLVVVLEEENLPLAEEIGQAVLNAAMGK